MFEDLRAAFREAIDNFNKELRRETVSETADRLLIGMKNEITDEKTAILALERELERTLAGAAKERDLGDTCRRRQRMALDIGDEETARIAEQQATKHESHGSVLDKKGDALKEEIAFRRNNVDEMLAKFGEAKQQRDALTATAGRPGARDTFAAADDLFGELDRMAEKIEGERRRDEAIEGLDDLPFGETSELHVEPDFAHDPDLDQAPREEVDVDAALAELKRRMGHR